MFGGLKKSASRLALVAAAGALSTGAYAADLGGDCCADLEERVAELEATTARKGTRKTSLEIWGQVNRNIVAWNDGINRDVALGLDNVNASTRFGLRGSAKINPSLQAGYSIVIEQATGGRSTNLSQFRDKQSVAAGINTQSPPNGFGANDAAITMREANWWLQSSTVGRLTVGRFVGSAGPAGVIDLGGIGSTVASGSMSLNGTGLVFRTGAPVGAGPTTAGSPPTGTAGAGTFPTTSFSNYSIGNTTDSAGEYGSRQNGVLWTSPTFVGFTVSASIAGSTQADSIPANAAGTANQGYGPLWSVGVKYAGEFSGVRVAAAYGHEDAVNSNYTSMISTAGTSVRPHSTNDGFSLSLMHVPTGLFAQGLYNIYTRGHDLFTTGGAASVYSVAGVTKDTARQWLIQGGIAQNWFGLGNTAVYGEYGAVKNGYNTFGLEPANGNAAYSATGFGTLYTGDVTTLKMWGLGVQQNIDAAAMEIYAGYRNFSLSSDNCTAAAGCKDIGMFMAGSRIRF